MVHPINEVDDMKCAHRWVIETPTGNTMVSGWCRVCGETRRFRASWDEEGELAEKWGKRDGNTRTGSSIRQIARGRADHGEIW